MTHRIIPEPPTPVWVQLSFEHYEHVTAATSGLRGAAQIEYERGHFHTADEYTRLADQLARVLSEMTAAYREHHPPPQRQRPAPSVMARRGGPPMQGDGKALSRPTVPEPSPTETDGLR